MLSNDHASRLARVIRQEFADVARRHRLAATLTAPLPTGSLARTRAQILRMNGWKIGRGTVLAETPRLIGAGPLLRRLQVGEDVFVNVGNVWELSDRVSIGDRVAIGQDVMLLTSSHRIGSQDRRADELFTQPVVIEDGVWIGARSLVLPGVRIGKGALVAANTVVRHDVPADVLFAGNPGRVIRPLDEE